MASTDQPRLVLDTNVLVRGLANAESLAGRVVRACDNRAFVILLSREVLAEYRAVLGNPDVTDRHPTITARSVDLVIKRLRYVSDWYAPVRARFRFDRDPGDEPFIELAIAGSATRLVTFDKDFLSLSSGYSETAKRFRQRLPNVKVVDPPEFMREFADDV